MSIDAFRVDTDLNVVGLYLAIFHFRCQCPVVSTIYAQSLHTRLENKCSVMQTVTERERADRGRKAQSKGPNILLQASSTFGRGVPTLGHSGDALCDISDTQCVKNLFLVIFLQFLSLVTHSASLVSHSAYHQCDLAVLSIEDACSQLKILYPH